VRPREARSAYAQVVLLASESRPMICGATSPARRPSTMMTTTSSRSVNPDLLSHADRHALPPAGVMFDATAAPALTL
jgi:hypothetical protein